MKNCPSNNADKERYSKAGWTEWNTRKELNIKQDVSGIIQQKTQIKLIKVSKLTQDALK